MPKKKIDFDTVRTMGLKLPEVEESTMFRSPALKVRGRLLACIAINKSAEPGTLVVRTGFEERAEMIATAPDIYYVTNHYVNYPVVLVRMSQIGEDALQDLLGMGWRFISAAKPARPKRKAQPRGGRRKALR